MESCIDPNAIPEVPEVRESCDPVVPNRVGVPEVNANCVDRFTTYHVIFY